MSIFSKIRENAKSFKAAKQKQKEPTATAEKQKPELEKQKDDAQPQLQSGAIPTVAIQEAQEDDPQVQPEGKRASWRPAMNRTKSNESLKRLSAPALRNSTSAPNLRTLKHRSSDLSIESVMLSLDFPMPATTKKPTETMTLKSRNSLVAPNQFTYDPTKTPAFVGRKKGRPRRLHPSSRSSSFIRLQQIEPMAEENEDGETVDSSSTSTKSGSSGSSARTQYLEKKRSVQSSASTLSDAAGSSSSNNPSRRASWANSDRSGSSSASSVSDVTIPPAICEGVAVVVPVVQVSVAFADPPVTTTIPPLPAMYHDEDADADAPVVSVMEDDSPPASPKCSTASAALPTRSTFSLRKKRSWFRKKYDSGTITIF
ncbi:hypothetical protein IWX49DRAFT_593018 [Phyllosticta citricarpa]|uniref:Uncharacterized protein n=1 Tax=Phyllosticta citricarpa TaxID=55181 RepID=A0ABR1MFR5_9PEZI